MRFSALSTWHKYTISGNSCSIFIVKYGCNFLLLMTKWWDLGSCLLKGKTPVRRQSTARQAEFIGRVETRSEGTEWAPPLVHSLGIYGLLFWTSPVLPLSYTISLTCLCTWSVAGTLICVAEQCPEIEPEIWWPQIWVWWGLFQLKDLP